MTILHNLFQKTKWWGTLSHLFSGVNIILISKKDKESRRKELQTNISYEHRHKNPQQSISKWNPEMCEEDKIPQPWLVWRSGLGAVSQTGRLLVGFPSPGRAHAWVAGQPSPLGACERQLIDISLTHWYFYPSFSLHCLLSKNK